MQLWQQIFLGVFGCANLLVAMKGFHESKNRKNAFGLTYWLTPIGAFVWGDAAIFGIFWALVAAVTGWLNDWLLFVLTYALFWVVRSLGETMYWFQQQFSSINRNPPESLIGFRFFQNDSIWFVYQIIWQCVTVVSVIVSVYLGWLWLTRLGQG